MLGNVGPVVVGNVGSGLAGKARAVPARAKTAKLIMKGIVEIGEEICGWVERCRAVEGWRSEYG